jgi:alcohol dehydrogenase, propanol-preferring
MSALLTETFNTVRIAGRMVCVGTLSPENMMNMKRGIRKRLTVIFSYGGQREDLEELLGLMGEKVITPQTEEGKLEDFPRWLQDLCDGKVKARVALVPS